MVRSRAYARDQVRAAITKSMVSLDEVATFEDALRLAPDIREHICGTWRTISNVVIAANVLLLVKKPAKPHMSAAFFNQVTSGPTRATDA